MLRLYIERFENFEDLYPAGPATVRSGCSVTSIPRSFPIQSLVVRRQMIIGRADAGEDKPEEKSGKGPARACIRSQSGPENKAEAEQAGSQESQVREHVKSMHNAGDAALVGKVMVGLRLCDGLEKCTGDDRAHANSNDQTPPNCRGPLPYALNQPRNFIFLLRRLQELGPFLCPPAQRRSARCCGWKTP